jgi:uncharacterized protein DUF5677
MSLDDQGFLSPELEKYREGIRAKNKAFFKLIEDLNGFCQQTKYRFEIHNRDGQQIFAGCLLIKLLNDVQAAVILFEKGLISQGRSLLRIALESLIVLGKICESYEFVHAYAKIGEKDRLKLVQSIRSASTNVFDDIKPELTDELIKRIEETLEGKECTSNKEQWARDINLHHLYVGGYRLFSQDVHSSPGSLDELFMKSEESEVIGFEWGPNGDVDLRVELLEASRYLIYGMSFMNKLFELDIDEQLKNFGNQYKELDAMTLESSKGHLY